eukprot:4640713-Amphidinium_carterae.1
MSWYHPMLALQPTADIVSQRVDTAFHQLFLPVPSAWKPVARHLAQGVNRDYGCKCNMEHLNFLLQKERKI